MGYKKETKKTYDENADYFDQKFEEYKEKYMKQQFEKAISLFPENARILDLGSGPGNHAKLFHEKGFDVLCLDISEKSLEKCREKGLKTINAPSRSKLRGMNKQIRKIHVST